MKKTYIQPLCTVIALAAGSIMNDISGGTASRGSENGDPGDGESLSRETFFGSGSNWSNDEEE